MEEKEKKECPRQAEVRGWVGEKNFKVTRDRKQKYWTKDLIWLSKILVHGFRRALLNTGLSRQLQGSFSFSLAHLSVTCQYTRLWEAALRWAVRSEQALRNGAGGESCTHCWRQGKNKSMKSLGNRPSSSSFPLHGNGSSPLDGVHWPVLSTIITIQRTSSLPDSTILIIHTTQFQAIMSNNTYTQLVVAVIISPLN